MEEININIFNFISLVCLTFGIIFSIELLFKSNKKVSILIGWSILCICLLPFQKLYQDLNLHNVFMPLPFIPTDIMASPLFFVFTGLYLENVFYKKILLFSIVIFVLIFGFHTLFYFKLLPIAFDDFLRINDYLYIFTVVYGLCFFIPALSIFFKNKGFKIKWLTKLYSFVILVQLILIITTLLYTLNIVENSYQLFYPLWSLIGLGVYWLCYSVIPVQLIKENSI